MAEDKRREERENDSILGSLKRDWERANNAKGALSWIMRAKVAMMAVVAFVQFFWPLFAILGVIFLIQAVTIVLDLKADNQVSAAASKSVIQNKTYVDVAPAPDGQDGYYFKIDKKIIDEYIKELNKAYESGVYDNALIEDDEEDSEDSESTQQGESQAETQEDADEAETEEEEDTETDEADEADRAEASDGETHYDEDTLAEWFQTDDRTVWEPYLIKMIRAEIASSYPYLGEYEGEVDSSNEINKQLGNKKDAEGNYVAQGVVKIKRQKKDGEPVVLSYIPSDKYNEMLSSNDDDILDYYSFDPSTGIISYATVKYVTTTTTDEEGHEKTETTAMYSTSTASYKALTSMCSMPFNFTFSLLQMSQSPNWVSSVIDLLLQESNVEIMIYDEQSKETSTTINKRAEKIVTQDYTGYAEDMITVIFKQVGKEPIEIEIPYNDDAKAYLIGDRLEDIGYGDNDDMLIVYGRGNYIDNEEQMAENNEINLKFEDDEDNKYYIAGNCLVVGYDDETGDITSIPGTRTEKNRIKRDLKKRADENEEYDGEELEIIRSDIETFIEKGWQEGEKRTSYLFPFSDDIPESDENTERIETETDTYTSLVFISEAKTWCMDFEQTIKDTGTIETTIEEPQITEYSKDDYDIENEEEFKYNAPFYEETIDREPEKTGDKLTTTERCYSEEMLTWQTTRKIVGEGKEVGGDGKKINYKRFLSLWENALGSNDLSVIFADEANLFNDDTRGKDVSYPLPPPNDNVQTTPSTAITGSSQEDIEELIDLLSSHEDTQMHAQLMMYFWNKYMREDMYEVNEDELINLFNKTQLIVVPNTRIYGSSLEEKVWFALLDAGYSEYAAAGAMGNIYAESTFSPKLLEYKKSNKLNSNDYTTAVDNGTYTKDEFINDKLGYGLCQWTYWTRKEGLFQYVQSKGVSIGDENAQIEYMLAELDATNSSAASSYATYQLGSRKGYNGDSWINATSVEEAATAFCWSFENPGVPRLAERISSAEKYYAQFHGKQRASFEGETVQGGKYLFPHYYQRNYKDVIYSGTVTVSQAGCGPTSLSMILSGLLGDPSINPATVVANIKEYWPGGDYYVKGQGSSHCIFSNNKFLSKYYGVTAEYIRGSNEQSRALAALDAGFPVIGGEQGHILAIVPVTEEEKAQGYKFRIMDSARGHDGLYKSVAEANNVVRGSLKFNSIIRP